MRRILILLAALALPFAIAQSASASHASEIDGRAVVTFYDAAGAAIGTAGAATGLESAVTVEVVTPDGTAHTLDVTGAADGVADTTVMHRGAELPLLTVLAEIAADADLDADAAVGVAPKDGGDAAAPEEGAEPEPDAEIDAEIGATVEVEVDEEAGTTTRTVTTPAGVVVRIVKSADTATEVTVDRADAPEHEGPEAPAEPDAPSEAPDDDGGGDGDADDEADAEAEAEVDVGVGIGAGVGRAAD